jgi:Disulphide bond corrector protein DsbC
VAATAIAILLVGCGARLGSAPPEAHASYPNSRVDVVVRLETTGDGTTVVAEFRPTQPDLHLYGLALPPTGIDGAGRPTRADIVDAAWRAVGSPRASVAAAEIEIDGFAEPFPVYPEGPVTIRQDVGRTGGPDPAPGLDVAVTFMACSTSGLCFAPVERAVLTIPVD